MEEWMNLALGKRDVEDNVENGKKILPLDQAGLGLLNRLAFLLTHSVTLDQ